MNRKFFYKNKAGIDLNPECIEESNKVNCFIFFPEKKKRKNKNDKKEKITREKKKLKD